MPGLVVGGEGALDPVAVFAGRAAAAEHVDDGGDAGGEQARRAQQGVEADIHRPRRAQGQKPGFEQQVGDAVLRPGDAVGMVVRVDEAGHDGDVGGAEDFGVRMGVAQHVPRADLTDGVAFDQNGAVGKRFVVRAAARDDPPASYDGCIRHRPLPFLPTHVIVGARSLSEI